MGHTKHKTDNVFNDFLFTFKMFIHKMILERKYWK